MSTYLAVALYLAPSLLVVAVCASIFFRERRAARDEANIRRRIHESDVHQSIYTPAQLESALRKGKS